jgi:hypothetical protein
MCPKTYAPAASRAIGENQQKPRTEVPGHSDNYPIALVQMQQSMKLLQMDRIGLVQVRAIPRLAGSRRKAAD